MNIKECPKCGKPLAENANFCMHCGNEISKEVKASETEPSTDKESLSSTQMKENSQQTQENALSAVKPEKKQENNESKKTKLPVGYLIFLAIITSILIWLINKKINAVEEKPMHSLPSERPQLYKDFDIIDSLSNDTIYAEEVSLLSPELPKIRIKEISNPVQTDNYSDYSDYSEDYQVNTNYQDYSINNNSNRPNRTIQLTTEQSIRNLLVSNRFVDPITSDVLTFRNNGNTLLKNGDTLAIEMEVSKLNTNTAILDYYDSANTSWDIQLDVSGQSKKIKMMDNTYISD